jgi:hypothetical protein
LVRVKWGLVLYQVVSAVVLLFIVYSFTKFDSSWTNATNYAWDYFACICSKNCFASFHVRYIFRVGAGSINYFDDNERADFLNSRRNL